MKSRGFTLIELMVIMAVIGILAVIIVGAARTDHERNAAKAEAEYTVTASEQAAVRAHTAGHDYTNRAYFKEVILNVSADFQPVCVHGIPGFIVKRGVNQGEFVQLRDYRGYKATQRFWMACQDMGGELVKKHENE